MNNPMKKKFNTKKKMSNTGIQNSEYNDEILKRNADIVLKLVKGDRLVYKRSWGFEDNFEIMMEVVRNQEEPDLDYASDNLKDTYLVVMEAVTYHGLNLKYASKTLQNNRQIVLKAVEDHPSYIKYASYELKDDYTIAMKVVDEDGEALEYFSERLKDDINVVRTAVQNDGRALEYVSLRLRNNRDIVKEAVIDCPRSYIYASEDLKLDLSVVVATIEHIFEYDDTDAYNQLSDSMDVLEPMYFKTMDIPWIDEVGILKANIDHGLYFLSMCEFDIYFFYDNLKKRHINYELDSCSKRARISQIKNYIY